LTSYLYPGIIDYAPRVGSMTGTFTAFAGERRLASGPLADVALAAKRAKQHTSQPIVVFSDATGGAVDLDLRGSEDEVLARLPTGAGASFTQSNAQDEPRGRSRPRGRPRLGVVAREGDKERRRVARDAAYRFMSAISGHRINFEEASRALFANDRRRLASAIGGWPSDIRDHVVKLAFGDDAELIP